MLRRLARADYGLSETALPVADSGLIWSRLHTSPPPLSTRQEKPRRFRLNEHLGRHESATGPLSAAQDHELKLEPDLRRRRSIG